MTHLAVNVKAQVKRIGENCLVLHPTSDLHFRGKRKQFKGVVSGKIVRIVMAGYFFFICRSNGKSILQVPDTGTRVLDNTRPYLRSSIVSF